MSMIDWEFRLAEASGDGNSNTVQKLLKRYVDPNSRDRLGASVISKAAKGGHTEVVRLLLAAGAQANGYDNILVTPLHLAAQGAHAEAVKYLLLAGAQFDFKNIDGFTPIHYCKHESETWEILRDAAAGEMPEIEDISEVPEIP